jgi:5'-3' exonuclease
MSKRLLLLDVSHVFWSSYFASAGSGDPDAPYAVTLERISRLGDGYDTKVACCDVGASFRKRLLPTYKEGRPERDAAAYDQLRRVKEQLMRDGWPVIGVDDFEADDLIATLVDKAPQEYTEIVIASGDKDLMQLVADGVTIQSTNSGGGIYDAARVKEKFGVMPGDMVDYLALVGDKSDAVAGCPGCGPVNAVRLLTELGPLENMFRNPEAITPPGIREKFTAAMVQIKLAQELVTLRRDVPISWEDATKAPEVKPENVAPPVPDEGDDDAAPVVPQVLPAEGESNQEFADRLNKTPNVSPTLSAKMTRVEPESALVLDKADPRWTLALEPRNGKMLWWYCEELHKSQLYRKFMNADAIMAVVLRGRALGLDMTTSLDVFHVIEGKPTLSAMAIVGLCLTSGRAEYFDPIEFESDVRATWETKRVGREAKRLTYTIEDAELAGLTRPTKNGQPSNWVKRPRPMLRKQAAVELARLVYPDVVSNIYSPDEMTD